MPGWKSTKEGKHFQIKSNAGLMSNEYTTHSNSGTQLSSMQSASHHQPKKPTNDSWVDSYLDKTKLRGALNAIEQSRDPDTGEYENEADYELDTIFHALYHPVDAQHSWETLQNSSNHLVERDLLERIDKKPADIIINQSLKKYYDNAEYLYRGTTPDELENMLTHDNIGDGGGNFDHVPITPFPQSALMIGEFGGVVIQFYKDALDKHIIFQGYDVNQIGDSYEKNNPQGLDLLGEGEVRLPDETIPHKGTIKQIIFTGTEYTPQQKKDLKNKFSKLGHVKFLYDKNFKWDEVVNAEAVMECYGI